MDLRSLITTVKTFMMILLITFIVDKIVFFVLNAISDEVLTGQSIGKLNHYLKVKDDLDLIVYGSSRANHSIDPNLIIENGFNMGMDGRKLAYSETLIKLLPENKNQFILLHIDPDNAFDQKYEGRDIKALGSKYNRIEAVTNDIDRAKQNNIFQNVFWSLSYNGIVLGVIKNYLIPSYDYETFNGFEPLKVNAVQKQIFKNTLEENVPELCQNRLIINQYYDLLLEELKKFCNENNKKIIIFTAPKYADSCKEDNLEFRQIMKDKNFTYYDLTDYFRHDNKMEYWKDKIHLSEVGAALVTERMSQILEPYLQSG